MFYTEKTKSAKTTVYAGLKSKNRTHHGQIHVFDAAKRVNKNTGQEGYQFNAVIEKNMITLFGLDYKGTPYAKEFKVGDVAEYDSWNLIYTGTITKITDKAVTIVARGKTVHRLDINQFAQRNWNFDAERASKHNAEEMMYI